MHARAIKRIIYTCEVIQRHPLRASFQMDNAVTKENLTTPERNGLMDVTMSVSVKMEQAVDTDATTGA